MRVLNPFMPVSSLVSHTSSLRLYRLQQTLAYVCGSLSTDKEKGKSTCYFWHFVLTSAVC